MEFTIKIARNGRFVERFSFESETQVDQDELLKFAHRLISDEQKRNPGSKIHVFFVQNGKAGFVIAES